jgi:hypothetical protein
VLILVVLSHLEMFNARKIVKARAANASDDAISALKKKHATMGLAGTLVFVALLILVTFVRLA